MLKWTSWSLAIAVQLMAAGAPPAQAAPHAEDVRLLRDLLSGTKPGQRLGPFHARLSTLLADLESRPSCQANLSAADPARSTAIALAQQYLCQEHSGLAFAIVSVQKDPFTGMQIFDLKLNSINRPTPQRLAVAPAQAVGANTWRIKDKDFVFDLSPGEYTGRLTMDGERAAQHPGTFEFFCLPVSPETRAPVPPGF